MNHPAASLALNAGGRSMLAKWAHSATVPHRVVSRAKTLLMAGDGVANSRIATAIGTSRPTALDWRGLMAKSQAAVILQLNRERHSGGLSPVPKPRNDLAAGSTWPASI